MASDIDISLVYLLIYVIWYKNCVPFKINIWHLKPWVTALPLPPLLASAPPPPPWSSPTSSPSFGSTTTSITIEKLNPIETVYVPSLLPQPSSPSCTTITPSTTTVPLIVSFSCIQLAMSFTTTTSQLWFSYVIYEEQEQRIIWRLQLFQSKQRRKVKGTKHEGEIWWSVLNTR